MDGRDAVGVRAELEWMRQRALERPDDLETHLVYADALMEEGDALGELIHRQCVDPETEVSDALARRVLGRLYGHVDRWRIERGFLRDVRLFRQAPRLIRRLIGLSEFEGVRSLSFARGPTMRTRRLPAAALEELMAHPTCRVLREVTMLDDETFRRLAATPRSFDRVNVHLDPGRMLEFGAVNFRVKVLRVIHLIDVVGWLFAVGRPLLDCAETLELSEMDLRPLLLLQDPGELRRLETTSLSATREGKKWHVAVTLEAWDKDLLFWNLPEVVTALRGVSPMLASLEVRMPDYGPAVLERIRLSAGDVPFEVVVTGLGQHFDYPLVTSDCIDAPF